MTDEVKNKITQFLSENYITSNSGSSGSLVNFFNKTKIEQNQEIIDWANTKKVIAQTKLNNTPSEYAAAQANQESSLNNEIDLLDDVILELS